ncbi:MAG: alpha-glucosidase C-terminal domain-containing protein [Desulfarculaceae bacterium]|nr:alpha-glucosidase C-terminal domain-containing protein [Desulfarculaceae bacterium]MCF8073824.1 alpha-glucosidase C-terminal domain-containing protein [Desulfarculaceae bacterium]MCF8102804.1 alpha-glucosidase C-terminal domain-containing protein [Desulfarculaceae bacterium]MCF8116248.1 alpha-glucosidase C-terminal domain-containing protein [Desulfarculaceae bacterium]
MPQKPVPPKAHYDTDPDYSRPRLEIPPERREHFHSLLASLYGAEVARALLPELERIIQVHHAHKPEALRALEPERAARPMFSQGDLVLITYGDMIAGGEGTPLATLAEACDSYMEAPDILHILPFFPYSSDRGFSVVDLKQVDPRLGSWDDIHRLAGNYRLMFDGVLNHLSARSEVFQDFLAGRPDVQDFFIAYNSPDELTPDQRSKIFRPRVSDILTPFTTINGMRYVWTTFSPDQIDLNYRHPPVLLEVVDALLFYIRQGADLLRLDAVTYVWAEPGTECVHLPQTHAIVKMLRAVVELAAPGVALITETNVPHADNVSYFGDGFDEAHMVYNFALPPLVLHAIYRGDASYLAAWARELEPPSQDTYFFNILDTHDGVGLMGVKEILPREELKFIEQSAQANGALVSYKTVEGGGEEPYEINSTWWSAINRPHGDLDRQVARYVASRAVCLSLKGVPGVYLHGALGSENDMATYERTHHKRDLNRATVDLKRLEREWGHPGTKLNLMGNRIRHLRLLRVAQPAFHPQGRQQVLDAPRPVLALLRTSPGGKDHLLSLINFSDQAVSLELPLPEEVAGVERWRDLVAGDEALSPEGKLSLELRPYQVAWLRPLGEIKPQ